jgi:GntR family transcriptional regulator of vanillate catabolism
VQGEPGTAPSQTVRALMRLRELILAGELAAGERLSELSMVELLGVSRTPVRAALARLAEEGLLEPLPGGGFAVRLLSEAEIATAIEIRGVLEGTAVRLAAERGVDPVELRGLKDCLDDLDRLLGPGPLSLDGFSRYVELNERFHGLLARLPRSEVLARTLERAASFPFASPGAFVMAQAELPESRRILVIAQEQHRGLVEAIERREGARGEALAREHARLSRQNLEIALRDGRARARLPGARLLRLAQAG